MLIKKDQLIFEMNSQNEPVLTVPSGSRVTFQTRDCFSDTVQTKDDVVSGIDFSQINPASGPLAVEGAAVGDVLKVDIHEIRLADQAAAVIAPGLGRLADKIEAEETVILEVTDQSASFLGYQLPLRKMIGVIGTAPKPGAELNTGTPGGHGGNMDCTAIQAGTTLYLPVNVEGGLLAMGDLHATMGDGEVNGCGAEIAGEVDVTVTVLKDCDYPTPLVESESSWTLIAAGATMEEASDSVIDQMAQFVSRQSELSYSQAGLLLSLAGDLGVAQIVNPAVTMTMTLDKSILTKR